MLKRLVFITLLVILPFGWAASGWGSEQQRLQKSRRDLEQIQSRIDTTSADLEKKRKESQALTQQLRQLQQRLRRARLKVAESQKRLERLQEQIADQQKTVDAGQARIARLEREVRKRLVALYKGGDTQVVKVLFSAESPADLVENFEFLQRLVRRDRDLLSNFRDELQANRQRLDSLASLKQEREGVLAKSRQQQDELSRARQEQRRLLAKVRKDERALAAMLEELEEKARRLSSLVKKLETEKPGTYTAKSTSFATQKGHLDWPVKGPVRIGFGPGIHPQLGTRYDSHGLEIGARPGQPIRAVWDGRVVFANQFRGYGNLLILDHGEGYYSLYAQAAKLNRKVGDQVSRDDIIAISGFEGSDVVYFEIRQGGTPLDPAGWLTPKG